MVCVAGLTLLGVAYIGGQAMRRPSAITVEPMAPPPAASPARFSPSVEAPTSAPNSNVVVPASSAEVVVHVAGAVKSPKVVRLPPGSRIEDAIKAAGGAKPDADLEKSVNLAEKLVDGEKIYIHGKADKDLPVVEGTQTSTPPSASSVTPKTAASTSREVHLNTATLADLDTLPGVGPATAQKILDYRQDHGGFSSVEEIMAVKGIGQKKFDAMKRWLRL